MVIYIDDIIQKYKKEAQILWRTYFAILCEWRGEGRKI